MEAKPLTLKTLALCVLAVLAVEALARVASVGSSLAALGAVRLLEIFLIAWIVVASSGGASAIGLEHSRWLHGLKRGLLWSVAFGAVALCALFLLHAARINILGMIRAPLPREAQTLALLFVVGGIIAPVAEEMFFRGLLYGFFRRWGVAAALIVSTLLFVFSHPLDRGLPVTQAVGGLVFALAYEVEGNLLAPITIHVLGNLAIFALSAAL